MDFAELWDAKETKIGDDNFTIFQENIFGLEVFVDDPTRMEITHTLENENKTYPFRR